MWDHPVWLHACTSPSCSNTHTHTHTHTRTRTCTRAHSDTHTHTHTYCVCTGMTHPHTTCVCMGILPYSGKCFVDLTPRKIIFMDLWCTCGHATILMYVPQLDLPIHGWYRVIVLGTWKRIMLVLWRTINAWVGLGTSELICTWKMYYFSQIRDKCENYVV